MMPLAVPYMLYQTHPSDIYQWVDLWNCLYRERVIFIGTPVDNELGNQMVATILYLDNEKKKDLQFYINCSGGEVVPCLAIHDTMRDIRNDVATVGFGHCLGMIGFLLGMGTKGKRHSLENTQIMLHHPSGIAHGQASDMTRECRELLRLRDYIDGIIAEACNQPFDKVVKDLRRNKYFNPQEALEYGLIDAIVPRVAPRRKT